MAHFPGCCHAQGPFFARFRCVRWVGAGCNALNFSSDDVARVAAEIAEGSVRLNKNFKPCKVLLPALAAPGLSPRSPFLPVCFHSMYAKAGLR